MPTTRMDLYWAELRGPYLEGNRNERWRVEYKLTSTWSDGGTRTLDAGSQTFWTKKGAIKEAKRHCNRRNEESSLDSGAPVAKLVEQ